MAVVSRTLQIDRRIGSEELAAPLKRMGIKVEVTTLDCADAAWQGHGPKGRVSVGVERKKLTEMLACFGDSRFVSRQLPRLVQAFDVAWLLVEGVWTAGKHGELQTQSFFGPRRQTHSYEALTGFLLTLQLKAGLRVVRTAGFNETVWWLHTAYRHAQKPWDKHHSAYALDTVRVPFDAQLATAPPLVRLVAAQLPGIGWERSAAVAATFPDTRAMVAAGWRQWAVIDGIGEVTARRVVAALKGESDGRTSKG